MRYIKGFMEQEAEMIVLAVGTDASGERVILVERPLVVSDAFVGLEWITWELDADGECYRGHYMPTWMGQYTIEDARKDFLQRLRWQ